MAFFYIPYITLQRFLSTDSTMAFPSQSLKLSHPTFKTEIEEDFTENGTQNYIAKKKTRGRGKGEKTSVQEEVLKQANCKVCGISPFTLTVILQRKPYVKTALNIR